MEPKLFAIISSGRPFALELSDVERGNLNQALESVKSGKPPYRAEWLRTEEGFEIRRDAIAALVVGRKQGEWVIADR